MSQTAYQQDPYIAVPGMLVDSSLDKDIISKVLTDATLSFGLAATHDVGQNDRKARAPAATGEVTGGAFFGVAWFDATIEQADPPVGFSQNDVMGVLRSGRIWVLSEDIVATIGLPAFVRFVAAGAEELGAFRTDADTSDAVALPGATFRTTTSGANQLVVLELAPTA